MCIVDFLASWLASWLAGWLQCSSSTSDWQTDWQTMLSFKGKLVTSEEDASMALHVSNALTQALLQFRMNNLPKEVITCLYYKCRIFVLKFFYFGVNCVFSYLTCSQRKGEIPKWLWRQKSAVLKLVRAVIFGLCDIPRLLMLSLLVNLWTK